MANKITYVFEFDDKGRVKVDNLTKGFVKLETAMKKVTNETAAQAAASSKANAALGNTISNAGLAGAVLTETGRTISDFNYGIRGVANNLSQLSTLFITLIGKQEETGLKGFKSAMSSLGQQLMGPMGIIIAFQLVITVIEGFSMANDEAKESTENLTQALDEQMLIFDSLAKDILKYNVNGKALKRSVATLRAEFKDFAGAYDNLTDKGEESVKNLIEQFIAHQDLQKEIKLTREQLKGAVVGSREYEITQNRLIKLVLKRTESEKIFGKQAKKRNKDEKILIEGSIDFYEAQIAILRKAQGFASDQESFTALQDRIDELSDLVDRITGLKDQLDIAVDEELEALLSRDVDFDISINDLKFKNTEFPDFIDDLDEYVDGFLKQRGKASLTQKILGLEPASREKDLKALEREIDMRFTPLLRQTDEYRAAVKAINDKWDEKDEKTLDKNNKAESKARFDHWNGLAKGFASFMNNIALLNEGNKDLARASIIASAAATSIGIWEAWFVDDKVSPPPIKLAGAIATQAALVASTAAALKSLNTNTPIGGAGSAATGSSASPQFNVVGQEVGQMGQLASAITGQTGEPIRAYVVLDDVNSAAELDNKITTSGSIG
jgi:hypothetical protein